MFDATASFEILIVIIWMSLLYFRSSQISHILNNGDKLAHFTKCIGEIRITFQKTGKRAV